MVKKPTNKSYFTAFLSIRLILGVTAEDHYFMIDIFLLVISAVSEHVLNLSSIKFASNDVKFIYEKTC